MPTYVSGNSGKAFTPAPEGAHQAVCVDVVELGLLETPWGQKRKLDVRWQISENMDNGKPFMVTKRYTASLNEKANLRHDLEAWRGRAFTESELEKFDVETLIGVNCLVNVIHKTGSKGGIFANVASVTPTLKNMPKMTPRDYVREKDRTDTPGPDEGGGAADEQADPDWVPF